MEAIGVKIVDYFTFIPQVKFFGKEIFLSFTGFVPCKDEN